MGLRIRGEAPQFLDGQEQVERVRRRFLEGASLMLVPALGFVVARVDDERTKPDVV